MCVTNCHDMTIAVKVALNLNTTNQPLTLSQNLDSSKLREFADDNFEFDDNGRKFSKKVENTAGKGESLFGKELIFV